MFRLFLFAFLLFDTDNRNTVQKNVRHKHRFGILGATCEAVRGALLPAHDSISDFEATRNRNSAPSSLLRGQTDGSATDKNLDGDATNDMGLVDDDVNVQAADPRGAIRRLSTDCSKRRGPRATIYYDEATFFDTVSPSIVCEDFDDVVAGSFLAICQPVPLNSTNLGENCWNSLTPGFNLQSTNAVILHEGPHTPYRPEIPTNSSVISQASPIQVSFHNPKDTRSVSFRVYAGYNVGTSSVNIFDTKERIMLAINDIPSGSFVGIVSKKPIGMIELSGDDQVRYMDDLCFGNR